MQDKQYNVDELGMPQLSVALSKELKRFDGRLEDVPAWGGASSGMGWVFRPINTDQLAEVFAIAHKTDLSIGLRGGGNSYGDAAYNSNGIVLDLCRFNRVLDWNPETGVIRAEPGLTIHQLWEYTVEDGWWPPVATGTAKTTLGGCAAMNVHGKNAFKVGPIGDHILEFDLMLPSGEIITCKRNENSDIFFAAIGGFGMLGCFTSITLQMKRVYSGLLDVVALASTDLSVMFEQFWALLPTSDYLVGWVDGVAGGNSLGRGQVHKANYLAKGVDPYPEQSLRVDNQNLGDTIFGIVPRSIIWQGMRLFTNNYGLRAANLGKYAVSYATSGSKIRQPHAQFHFLLDYVPNWKKSYGGGGLIQYQPFIPRDSAENAFKTILRTTQRHDLPTYLGVLKRHRPDAFLMTHGLDGFSLALDFRITQANRQRIVRMVRELDEIVLDAGGRFYPAKDSTLRPSVATAYLGADTIARFRELKQRYDPDSVLQTNLWRRVFMTP
ncbi:MAG: FAD-binding oxidoreductase [Anaerolineae bacterium]|nr:FAD-binding oxidoreductase [Anaerolineae bacterium]